MKELLSSVKEVRAAGKFKFEIETNGPNPIMAANLNDIYIMDKGWAEANNAVKVQDIKGGEDTFAAKKQMAPDLTNWLVGFLIAKLFLK